MLCRVGLPTHACHIVVAVSLLEWAPEVVKLDQALKAGAGAAAAAVESILNEKQDKQSQK